MACSSDPPKEEAKPVELTGLANYGLQVREHVESNVTYAQTPPVGGPHNPVWQNCGIYAEPIRKEMGVHSMEHGAVWITYRPDLPAAAVDTLRALVRGRSFALLTPDPELPSPIVASAWGVQMGVDWAGDPRLATFVAQYVNGPQTPEPGAPCTGGGGTPVG
jgi:hypothetical protein